MTCAIPNIVATGCNPQTLSVFGGYVAFVWNTGATTSAISVSSNGLYSVTVSCANGCTSTASIRVNIGCPLPTNLSTTSITSTSAMANWTPATCCVSYTIKLTNMVTLVTAIYNIPCNSHYAFSGLSRGAEYCWQIQTNCNANGTINSGFSPQICFNTPRLADEKSGDSQSAFDVYPNPTNGQINISFYSDDESNFTIKLYDVIGRLVINESHESSIGNNQLQMNIADIAKGVYILIFQKDDGTLQKKIIVQ